MNLKIVRIIDYYFGIFLIAILSILNSILKITNKNKSNSDNTNNTAKTKKILLIKFFGIGNLVMISPCFKLLKDKSPESKIDFLTLYSNKGVLENYKEFINNIYYMKLTPKEIFLSVFKLLHELRTNNYDIVIDFDQFARYSAIFSYLTNAEETIGFKTEGAYRHYLYTKTIPYNGNKHVVEEFADLLSLLNIKYKELKLIPLVVSKADKKFVDDWLTKNNLNYKKIIGMHVSVGPNAKLKEWPYFSELIDMILTQYSEAYIVLTTGKTEYNDTLAVKQKTNKQNNNRIIIANEINLIQLPYLLSKFKMFISNDTGPIHIASAENIEVIGLYGPASPIEYGPYTTKKHIFYKQLNCSPCITNFNNKETKCKDNICMKTITVNDVFSAVKEILR